MKQLSFPVNQVAPTVWCRIFKGNSGALEMATNHKYIPHNKPSEYETTPLKIICNPSRKSNQENRHKIQTLWLPHKTSDWRDLIQTTQNSNGMVVGSTHVVIS